jgi:MFS family permease
MSSFGQTFLISLFVPYFLSAFNLSNASFGTLYSAATLSSATLLPWLGQWIDRVSLKKYSLYVVFGLLFAAILMSISWHIATLFISLILLRLTGQGLSGHTAQTTMARYGDLERGKALSISALGYPLGEALLPSAIAALLVVFNWRTTWGLIAGTIAFLFIPLIYGLVKNERIIVEEEGDKSSDSIKKNYAAIFGDVKTFFVIPAILMPPFWVTGLFLYQVAAAESLGWTATLIATAFVSFAVFRILSGLISGPLIDRFTAKKLFPLYLFPMIVGFFIAWMFEADWAAFVYMALIGVTMGLGSTLKSALWAEMYGTKMIGTVQSLFASLMVLSTSISPILVGWMLDSTMTIHTVLMIAVVSSLISVLFSLKILPVFNKK